MGGHDTTGASLPERVPNGLGTTPILFYDGDCGLCHAAVKFALARDRRGHFSFAPLDGTTWAKLLDASESMTRNTIDTSGIDLRNPPDSVILLDQTRLLIRTRAVTRLLRGLDRPWPAVGAVLRLVPPPIANLGYRAIAALRHALFRRPDSVCPLVPPNLRSRFLD